MAIKNRYAIGSRISEAQFRQIARLFALDLDATHSTVMSALNRNIVNRYLQGIRQRIAEYCEAVVVFGRNRRLVGFYQIPSHSISGYE